MKDLKHQGLGASLEVMQQRRKARAVSNALSLVGALIGALSVYLMVVVVFEGAL